MKYGYSAFSVEIIVYCDPSEVISKEQYYLDLLNPEYNIKKVAGSPLGHKHSEEAKAKMSAAWTEERKTKMRESWTDNRKAKMSAARLGSQHSEETKAKMSAARQGRQFSDETKAKLSAAWTEERKAKMSTAWTEERRAKLSASLKGNKNASARKGYTKPLGSGKPSVSVEALDMETGEKTIYSSMTEAAKALGIPLGSIRMYLTNQKLYKGRYLLQKLP